MTDSGERLVLDFIDQFRNPGTVDVFTHGCCYWFARILEQRFAFRGGYEATLYYNPVLNHFACGVSWRVPAEGLEDVWRLELFDITGRLAGGKDWVPWQSYRADDPLDSDRVKHDCILKLPPEQR